MIQFHVSNPPFLRQKAASPSTCSSNVEDEFDEDEEEGTITIYGDDVKAYAQIQKFLEDQGFEDIGGEFTYVPNDLKDIDAEQRATINKMVERLEDFDDVQNVYTNMKPEEGE